VCSSGTLWVSRTVTSNKGETTHHEEIGGWHNPTSMWQRTKSNISLTIVGSSGAQWASSVRTGVGVFQRHGSHCNEGAIGTSAPERGTLTRIWCRWLCRKRLQANDGSGESHHVQPPHSGRSLPSSHNFVSASWGASHVLAVQTRI
jgi:hypothetical protein